jgi:hypothetical protein
MTKKKDDKAKVHKDLKGLEIDVNSFGEVTTNLDIDKINKFLDNQVEDKKLVDREDLKKDKKKKK